MAAVNRLRTVYKWDEDRRMTCLAPPPAQYEVKVAQGFGVPGWLCLTRDSSSQPVAYWVQRNRSVQILRIVLDDRCFEDTILRVEYTPTHVFIADVWMWNGSPTFKTTTFAWRQAFLEEVFPLVYTSCPGFESRAFALRNHVGASVRGYEYYTNGKGSTGKFSLAAPPPAKTTYEIHATEVPDVYRLAVGGYLRVKTLALSKRLAAMGKVFRLECVKNGDDDTWTPLLPQ
jgi:hypothetical protein